MVLNAMSEDDTIYLLLVKPEKYGEDMQFVFSFGESRSENNHRTIFLQAL